MPHAREAVHRCCVVFLVAADLHCVEVLVAHKRGGAHEACLVEELGVDRPARVEGDRPVEALVRVLRQHVVVVPLVPIPALNV